MTAHTFEGFTAFRKKSKSTLIECYLCPTDLQIVPRASDDIYNPNQSCWMSKAAILCEIGLEGLDLLLVCKLSMSKSQKFRNTLGT